jgi:hypothetical protein
LNIDILQFLLDSHRASMKRQYLWKSHLRQNDQMRQHTPFVQTTWQDMWKIDDHGCDVNVDMNETCNAAHVIPCAIDVPVTIPIRVLLLLSEVRWLPAFAGRHLFNA